MRSSEEKILKDGATLWWHCSSSVCFLPSCGSSRSWDLKKADCEKSWWHSSTSIGSGVVQQMSRSFYKKKRVFKLQDLVFGKWLGRWARYNLQRAYRSARGYLMFHSVTHLGQHQGWARCSCWGRSSWLSGQLSKSISAWLRALPSPVDCMEEWRNAV